MQKIQALVFCLGLAKYGLSSPAGYSSHDYDYYDSSFVDDFIDRMINKVIQQRNIVPIVNGGDSSTTIFSAQDFDTIYKA